MDQQVHVLVEWLNHLNNTLNRVSEVLESHSGKQEEEYLTTEEALEFLKMSSGTLTKRVKAGMIPRYGDPRNYRFKKSDLVNYLSNESRS